MYGSWSKLCSGNVKPSVFVVLQTDGTVQTSGANGDIFGISQPSVHLPGVLGMDDGFAGVANGPPINIYGPGDDDCPLHISATVTAGQLLKSDGSGFGTPATAEGDIVGARAVGGGVSGDVIRVKPIRFDAGLNISSGND